MRYAVPALILLLFTAASCANVSRFGEIMNPEELSKDELLKLPADKTPEYGFRVGIVNNLRGETDEILDNVDAQFSEFSQCFRIKDRGEEARRYTIAVVNGTFRCEYHHGRCNGEYDSEYGLIVVSYKAFNRRGVLPVLKHEWAHAYGILRDDHKNLKEVKWCTGY
jgi:hypothetical protein